MLKEQIFIEVYQFRIWVRHISPAIWRRILVRSDSTIADLHYTIQIAMGWTDTHLHKFVIHGKDYGVSLLGGISFSDNPNQVQLNQFNFRLNERFIYEYDFYDQWIHEIRFEKRLPYEREIIYPVCIGGARGTPPEDCGGAWKFMKLKQEYNEGYILHKILKLLEDKDDVKQNREFNELKYWLKIYTFNKPFVNRSLEHYALNGFDPKHWTEEMELCV